MEIKWTVQKWWVKLDGLDYPNQYVLAYNLSPTTQESEGKGTKIPLYKKSTNIPLYTHSSFSKN